jgi:hypothetical protein
MIDKMPLIFKFYKNYASFMGGIQMYECIICKKGCPTHYSLIGHLFDKHKLNIQEAKLLALRSK